MKNDFDASCVHKESYFSEVIISNDQNMEQKNLTNYPKT